MGGCVCLTSETAESRLISHKMSEHEEMDKFTSKLLLLGTGNTGKTTFFRQFRLMAGEGFTVAERESQRGGIEHQIVHSMAILAKECLDRIDGKIRVTDSMEFDVTLSSSGVNHAKRLVSEVESERTPTASLNSHTYESVKELWDEEGIKKLFWNQNDERMRGLNVPETCHHFWDDIERIGDLQYIPSDLDLIHLRSSTSGSSTFNYEFEGARFLIVDVGGQRCERKKWMNFFDNVNALLYVVSLSAYDEVLFEDSTVNAMTDQLNQFETVINFPVFNNTTVILFLNKKDLLETKVAAGRSIKKYFDEFNGDETSYKESVAFIRSEFLARNKNSERTIYSHITHAVDEQNAQRVLHDVTQSLVQRSLVATGLLRATNRPL